jgi:GMP reductase
MLSKTIRRNFSFNQYFDQVIQNKNRIPRIVDEVKFDFKDVLIRPQLTALKSRSQVNLLRNFKFRHHDTEWEGVPIMAANMDTVGTFEIAEEFSKEKMITCLMKHYSVEETVNWANKVGKDVLNNVAVAAGTSDRDF